MIEERSNLTLIRAMNRYENDSRNMQFIVASNWLESSRIQNFNSLIDREGFIIMSPPEVNDVRAYE